MSAISDNETNLDIFNKFIEVINTSVKTTEYKNTSVKEFLAELPQGALYNLSATLQGFTILVDLTYNYRFSDPDAQDILENSFHQF